ncbi:MAG TPA: thioredoxin domain-containing protein [Steroidobacteraceae bacterium]|nr:thioredoxin domain-containing protein [Steroidobacteraceae bacterium]
MDPAAATTPANRLSQETSPYLRQHAHNPVDWYPWGAAALERALAEHKPILLSVGYSACHWCHVMAHESFEDPQTAQVMNDLFINIKVDREERPDIDRIYQIAQQMLTQRSGGWPLTMFLTHDDQRPFFGGTYFPREARFGLPSFRDLLLRVAEYYRDHESELRKQNAALISAFDDLNPPAGAPDTQLTDAPLQASRAMLAKIFDPHNGGFGGAPKFPHPKTLERLLRDWHASSHLLEPDLHALYMATLTLRRMGDGGMNDQLGGGFARYSVDEYWMIPHFEKMLYDNGALLAVYADAAVATGDTFYARVAADTAAWAIRETQAPEGGYYSSYDADSEGHEGKFYVWDEDAVRQALTSAEYSAFAPHFGLDRAPNFEGRWHLHVFQSTEDVAKSLAKTVDEVEALLESARRKLLAQRNLRIWPGRDDKILTSWNALMIRGIAIAARALDRPDLADSATRALDFIRGTLWREGRLLATYKDGRAHLNAYLDDYVYLADAVLELQQVRFRSDELAFARDLLDVVLEHFTDSDGGFFFTSDDHETLIHRSKSFSDDATPAGNGVAAFVLQRLGHLLGDSRYLAAAEKTLRAAAPVLEKYPQGHMSLLIALEELLNPPETIILRGEAAAIETWRRDLARLYAPRRVVLAVPTGTSNLPQALGDKPARGEAVAYVCKGSVCSAPLESFSALAAHLRQAASHRSS